MFKVIKGKNIDEQIQSIDLLINSLFERRYSLAVDLIPPQVIQPIPISIGVPGGAIGSRAFPIAGKVVKLSCSSLNITKDTIIGITIISNNQSSTTKFSLPTSRIQDTDLVVPAGAEVDIEFFPGVESNVCVGLVFIPEVLK